MPPKIRVGIPSFIDDTLLQRFPPEAEIVRIDPWSKGDLDVEFLLAPWSRIRSISSCRVCAVPVSCSPSARALRASYP